MNPKDLIFSGVGFGVIAFGAFHWSFGGVEAGVRIGRADHMAYCQKNYKRLVTQKASSRIAKLERPDGRQVAMQRALRNTPFYQAARSMSRYGLRPGQANPLGRIFGVDPNQMVDMAQAASEQSYTASKRAYAQSVASIQHWAKRRMADANNQCDQAIVSAVEASRNEWALFSGSVGLIQMGPVRTFRQQIEKHLQKPGAA